MESLSWYSTFSCRYTFGECLGGVPQWVTFEFWRAFWTVSLVRFLQMPPLRPVPTKLSTELTAYWRWALIEMTGRGPFVDAGRLGTICRKRTRPNTTIQKATQIQRWSTVCSWVVPTVAKTLKSTQSTSCYTTALNSGVNLLSQFYRP